MNSSGTTTMSLFRVPGTGPSPRPRRARAGHERTLRRVTILVLAAAALFPCFAEDDADSRERALLLYEQGRYAEALPLLERLDAAGEASGPDLYRLYFCRRDADDPRALETLGRARTALEEGLATAPDLEIPFYLANTLRNSGRLSDAKRVASEATDRVERGDLAQPVSGVGRFRLAKLFADQERSDEAAHWYEEAIESLEAEEADSARPYIAWAARYLAERAWTAGDYESAGEQLARLATGDDVTSADLDRLASARIRSGRYADAKTAWQRAERVDRANADRFRYCWRLAALAASAGSLPAVAEDGRPWTELAREELEATLQQNATTARETIAEAAETKLRKRQRRKLQARLDEARGQFVAAGLEHALRRFGIRETAFFGGYAPLIFHEREWRLPQP